MKKRKNIKRHSFAILLYNVDVKGKVRVFLAHANGPRYWKRDTEKCWGIPKGRADANETAMETALREFKEEIGIQAPDVEYTWLMEHIRFRARRQITVFAGQIENMDDINFVTSNYQVKKYPTDNGVEEVKYQEILDARWFTFKEANSILLPGQRAILKKMKSFVKTEHSK